MTLEEHFGSLAGLNFTYVGDGNNVCHSLMLTGAQLGVNVTVATPRGYSPDIEIVTIAREMAEANAASCACCRIRRLRPKAPTPSIPTYVSAWATSTNQPSARPSSGRSR